MVNLKAGRVHPLLVAALIDLLEGGEGLLNSGESRLRLV